MAVAAVELGMRHRHVKDLTHPGGVNIGFAQVFTDGHCPGFGVGVNTTHERIA